MIWKKKIVAEKKKDSSKQGLSPPTVEHRFFPSFTLKGGKRKKRKKRLFRARSFLFFFLDRALSLSQS